MWRTRSATPTTPASLSNSADLISSSGRKRARAGEPGMPLESGLTAGLPRHSRPADYYDFWIENRGQAADGLAEPSAELGQNAQRTGISFGDCLINLFAGERT